MMKNENYCWWKHGVVYQVYPLSFYDSNGDGYGDLAGLTEKLPYLHDLGVKSLWLCPIHPSPWKDYGYDVSDYYSIHPKMGTLKDFEKFSKACAERDIKIILDFVFNHTSTEHPWFLEAKKSKENPKRNWYLWEKGRGLFKGPPNNWLAAFGGKAWQYEKNTDEYYLRSFDKTQADLNWRNPEVLAEAKNILKYWIELGVSGFRLDVVNFFLKDKDLKNNPWFLNLPPRPYDLQKHIYDRNQKENHKILQELRSFTNSFSKDHILIGEIYSPKPDPKLSASYMGANQDKLHLSLDFSLFHTKWDAPSVLKNLKKWHNSLHPLAWPSQTFSNHDEGRSFSRFFKNKHLSHALDYKALLTLLLTLRGTPFLYYGEELGMEDGSVSFKDRKDLLGLRYWPFYHGRDAFRTPMSWTPSDKGGFSDGEAWLPLNKRSKIKNVATEEKDTLSFLSVTKNLIKLRSDYPALLEGSLEFFDYHKDILSFVRRTEEQILLILVSFNSKNLFYELDQRRSWKAVFSTLEHSSKNILSNRIELKAKESLILHSQIN